jgi:hypothetical protein
VEALRELEADGALDDEHVAYLVAFIKRQMRDGVFGRSREAHRRDGDGDRAHFYRGEDQARHRKGAAAPDCVESE